MCLAKRDGAILATFKNCQGDVLNGNLFFVLRSFHKYDIITNSQKEVKIMDMYQKREMRKNKKMDENAKSLPSMNINWYPRTYGKN